MTWALNLAPVPMDSPRRGTKPTPSSACAFVLVGLANHAEPDGSNAFPGVATLARYTRLSERHVRRALDRLEEAGVIRPGDPAVVAARIKRGDRRPKGYDLNFGVIRDDLSDEEMERIGRSNPWLRPWIEAHQRGATAPREATNGVTPCQVVDDSRGDMVSGRDGHGVTPSPSRGDMVSPEPSYEPSRTTTSPSHPPSATDDSPGESHDVDEEFERIWRSYPRKVGKGQARRAFRAARARVEASGRSPLQVLMASLQAFQDTEWRGRSSQHIPHMSTWLNSEPECAQLQEAFVADPRLPEGWVTGPYQRPGNWWEQD